MHLQTLDSTFSLSVRSGVLSEDHDNFDKKKYFGSQARAQGQFDFVKDVAQWIPDFVAVLSIHDVPTQFVSWDHLEELRRLDKEGDCKYQTTRAHSVFLEVIMLTSFHTYFDLSQTLTPRTRRTDRSPDGQPPALPDPTCTTKPSTRPSHASLPPPSLSSDPTDSRPTLRTSLPRSLGSPRTTTRLLPTLRPCSRARSRTRARRRRSSLI